MLERLNGKSKQNFMLLLTLFFNKLIGISNSSVKRREMLEWAIACIIVTQFMNISQYYNLEFFRNYDSIVWAKESSQIFRLIEHCSSIKVRREPRNISV